MSELEEMLQGVLSDPAAMQQIMGLAQTLGKSAPPTSGNDVPTQESQSPMPDAGTVQQLTGLLKQAGLDSHQQALLTALSPYLSSGKIRKLKKAMQAARIAGAASSILGNISSAGR